MERAGGEADPMGAYAFFAAESAGRERDCRDYYDCRYEAHRAALLMGSADDWREIGEDFTRVVWPSAPLGVQ
jgi:hypothetical protein